MKILSTKILDRLFHIFGWLTPYLVAGIVLRAAKVWPSLMGGELFADGSIQVGEEQHSYRMPDGGLLQELLYTDSDTGERMCRTRLYQTPLTQQAILDLIPPIAPVTRHPGRSRERLLLEERDDG